MLLSPCRRPVSVHLHGSASLAPYDGTPMATTHVPSNRPTDGNMAYQCEHECLARRDAFVRSAHCVSPLRACQHVQCTHVTLPPALSLLPATGWAEDETCTGETKDYILPANRPSLGWYHDHALEITLDNAYGGETRRMSRTALVFHTFDCAGILLYSNCQRCRRAHPKHARPPLCVLGQSACLPLDPRPSWQP